MFDRVAWLIREALPYTDRHKKIFRGHLAQGSQRQQQGPGPPEDHDWVRCYQLGDFFCSHLAGRRRRRVIPYYAAAIKRMEGSKGHTLIKPWIGRLAAFVSERRDALKGAHCTSMALIHSRPGRPMKFKEGDGRATAIAEGAERRNVSWRDVATAVEPSACSRCAPLDDMR